MHPTDHPERQDERRGEAKGQPNAGRTSQGTPEPQVDENPPAEPAKNSEYRDQASYGRAPLPDSADKLNQSQGDAGT